MSRWSKGIISETIKSTGCSISKGTEVEYIRVKSIPNSFGFRLTEYEWHYKGNGTFYKWEIIDLTEKLYTIRPAKLASIAIGLVIFIQDAPIIVIIVIARKV